MKEKERLLELCLRRPSKENLNDIIEEIGQNSSLISSLYDMSFRAEKELIRFRAARIVEVICEKDIKAVELIINPLLQDYNKISNHSCQRIYAKMIAKCLEKIRKKKAGQIIIEAFERADIDELIEGSFNWIINKETPIASLMWSYEILLHYVDSRDWIRDDLLHYARLLVLENKSPGSLNYGKRVVNALSREGDLS